MNSPWNFGIVISSLTTTLSLSTQYLYGSCISRSRPMFQLILQSTTRMLGRSMPAPVPMRLRGSDRFASTRSKNYPDLIEKVFDADGFEVHHLKFDGNCTVNSCRHKYKVSFNCAGLAEQAYRDFHPIN